MSVTVRVWAGLAVVIAAIVVLPGGTLFLVPQGRAAPAVVLSNTAQFPRLTSGTLPSFPDNLTHFVYIVRENHVFDDYLGDCHSTINASCNGGTDYTSQSNYQADVPFLHDWARNYSVFDNMYSSLDPYSSQAHAYILTADASGSDPLCASGGVEGIGGSTEWGVYNSSSVKNGYCSFTSDGTDENYNPGGSIFDRFLGPNVSQSVATPPFLTIGDIIWNVASSGCTVSSTTGIPGTLPGNSQAVEHLSGCVNGWWYNTSTNSATMPPVLNPTTGIPQELFVCQDYCKTGPSPYLDQDSAYAFLSYVKDYGLPTYSYIRLGDDHPGSLCGSSEPYATCIQWNDASMNLILEDLMNSTSPYKDNTVIAITEDDTQNGQNNVDHINNGRRLPFVMVASHQVMRSGGTNPAACGISSTYSSCGLVIHPTFNTSNVLSVMERVEMNVNPSVFDLNGISPNRFAFPMVENDYLAEGNPLEPLWKCGAAGVPCNTGPVTQVLTSTRVTPNPVNAAVSTAVSLTASAMDQTGSPISGATYVWNLNPMSLGTLSSTTGPSVTFNAAATPGTGNVCENATYGATTLTGCAPVTVSTAVSLASVSLAPTGSVSVVPTGTQVFSATSLGSNGQSLTGSTTFAWNLNTTTLGSLSPSTGTSVTFTAGSSTGDLTLCVNGTYSLTTKMSCDALVVSNAPPSLTSVTLTPSSITAPDGTTRTFYAQALDQYQKPITSGITYQWTLTPGSLGSVSPTSGTSNSTLFSATSSGWFNGTLTVSAINALTTLVTQKSTLAVTGGGSLPLTVNSFTASPSSLPLGGTTYLNVSAAGGKSPYIYAYSNLPTGCSSANVSSLACAPTAAGNANVTVTVTDRAGSSVSRFATFQVVSRAGAPVIGSFYASPNPVSVGASTQFTVAVSGGSSPYTYAYAGLPPGCAANNAPTLACAPTTNGTFLVSVTVTDSAGAAAHASTTLTVLQSGGSAPSASPTPWLMIGLGVAILAVAAATVVLLARRRKRQSNLPPPEWQQYNNQGPPPMG